MPHLPETWPDMSLGQRLTWRRKRLGLTQARMAGAAGFSLDRLQRVEGDRGKLSPDELLPLLRAYDLTPAEWIHGARDPQALLQVAHTRPRLTQRIGMLEPAEVDAIERFVVNMTEGRTSGEP